MVKAEDSVRFRSKVAAAWLACVLGTFGAHWWYLGRRYAWAVTGASLLMLVVSRLYPAWWDSPPFLLLIIPMTAGFIEALVLALKPDEWFDAKYNAGSARHNETGWDAVFVAIAATFFGGTAMLWMLAMIVLHVYTAMGWLDEYTF